MLFYTHPVPLPLPAYLPLAGRVLALQTAYAGQAIWPWQGRWWGILATATVAAAALGLLLGWAGRQQGWRRIALTLLAVGLSVGLMAIA
mgnify:CR=1 FL=1